MCVCESGHARQSAGAECTPKDETPDEDAGNHHEPATRGQDMPCSSASDCANSDATYCLNHLTFSNGMGPVSDYRDLDENKAIGGRLYWLYDGLGELRLGGSAFYGTDTTAQESARIAADGKHVLFAEKLERKSDVLALALDLQWRYAGFLLQAELITQQRRFSESGRVGAIHPLFGQYMAPRDRLSWGVYGLVGYRFAWFGIMPYVLLQSVDTDDLDFSMRYYVNSLFAGFNFRPVDVLVIKLEYVASHFPRGFLVDGDFHMIQVQVAWAF